MSLDVWSEYNETSTLAQRDGNINKQNILKSLRNVSTTNDSELQEKFLENIKSPGKNFTHRNIPRHHLIHSKSQTSFSHQKELISGSCLNNHNFSFSKSYPQLYESIRDSEEENLHSNVQPDENPELERNSTSSSAPSNSSDSEESAIFTTSDGFKRQTESFSKSLDGIQEKTEEHAIPSWNGTHKSTTPRNTRGRSNNYEASRVRSKSVTTSVTKSTFDEYEDRLVPALKSYNGNEIVRECQMAFAQQSKTILNERERKQAALSISIFGAEMVEKFYSKNFNDKEEGLKDLQQELRRMVTSAQETNQKSIGCTNKAARAAVFLLHRALRDKVYSVYSGAAETIRMFFTEFVPDRVSSSEIARCVEKLLPELLTKSGDVTPRIHNMAAHTLLSMAESDEVRRLNIIPPQLSRPLMSSVHPRLALSRLEMVEQLILNHGISKDKRSGMTCRMLAEFGSSGLHHPAEAVRKVSERILLLVYKVNPRIVRKQLPPDDNVTRRNLLYRQLFQEFDFMDMQNKISQQDSNNDQAFIERECSPERKTILTKNIEVGFNEKKKSYNSDSQQRKHIIYLNLREKNTMKSSFASNSGKSPTKSNMLPNKTRIGPAPKVEFNLEEDSNSLPKNKKTSMDNEKNKDKLEQDFRSINMNKKESDVPKIKFPSLIDSIESTKARMLFNTQISKRTENLLPKNQARVSTVNNERHDSQTKKEIKKNFPSGIPLPKCGSTRKHYSSDPKKSNEKKEPENKPMLKNKLRNTEGGNTIESAEEKKLKEMVAFKKEMLETLKRSNEIFTSETFSPCLNKKPEKTIYRSPEKSNRFSESMLASIRENELPVHPLHNGLDRTHGTLKTCIFCLSSGKWPNDDSLNDHYMRDCLMLTMCEYCTEIIEISAFKNHLLDECNQRHLFKECPKCQQAVLEDLLDNHECLDLGKQPSPTRCPFCHTSIGDDESCWREHLVNNMCSNHPRQIK
ncbi:hypothetical protein RUM44_010086 [Polyplax serrata]|uniref:Centrosomal protein CEP104 Zn finger domain-containing protein n=1 Tax=Polyplax serrata TaxID=468196 RepID=A0ABR1AW25_POLSC